MATMNPDEAAWVARLTQSGSAKPSEPVRKLNGREVKVTALAPQEQSEVRSVVAKGNQRRYAKERASESELEKSMRGLAEAERKRSKSNDPNARVRAAKDQDIRADYAPVSEKTFKNVQRETAGFRLSSGERKESHRQKVGVALQSGVLPSSTGSIPCQGAGCKNTVAWDLSPTEIETRLKSKVKSYAGPDVVCTDCLKAGDPSGKSATRRATHGSVSSGQRKMK